MIHGNVDGVRNSVLNELDLLYSIKTQKTEFCSTEIINTIVKLSAHIEREISVAIDRRGKVTSIAIGDSTSVELPILDINEKRLAGVRVIHTHPNGYSNLSALDLTALLKLKLDSIAAVGVYGGNVVDFSVANLTVYNNNLVYEEKNNISLDELFSINILDKINYSESIIKENEFE